MSRPLWFVELLKRMHPHAGTIAELTHHPLVGPVVDYALFKDDDLLVLPQEDVFERRATRRVQLDVELEPPESMVLPSQVVEHFVREARVHMLLEHCICRQAHDCSGFAHDLGCLMLGESALQINPQLARRVSAEEALQHVARCQEAGLVHLIGRNKLDSVWLGASPGRRLMTICACCPCCCLWTVIPKLAPRIAEKVSRMPGLTVTVSDDCHGCQACADACFVDAIRVDTGHAEISDACRGCGRCVETCPEGAIRLEVTDDTFVRRSIERLAPSVDLG